MAEAWYGMVCVTCSMHGMAWHGMVWHGSSTHTTHDYHHNANALNSARQHPHHTSHRITP